MKKEDLRIVYLGTPDFAVETLRRLVEGGYNVVGVVTMPDKPIGRHQNHLAPSPVKTYAISQGLPLLQPANLKDERFIEQLRALRADLQIVVAFRMLPEVVWSMPPMGTFNVHASLLPHYRGAAPINWAIINGEAETGVSTFFLKHAIDTGDIIDRVSIPIGPDETFGDIHDRLMTLGADLAIKTVDALLEGTVQTTPQDHLDEATLKSAPKIFRDTCRIDWTAGIQRVHNHIRGLSPAPAAWTMLVTPRGETMLKIYHATMRKCDHQLPIGALQASPASLDVALEGGFLCITDLQLAGKKRMTAQDFLRGYKVSTDDRVV